MLGLAVLAGAGCKDKKQPYLDAKVAHEASLATIGAYAPLVAQIRTPIVAHAARRRIVDATARAAAAEGLARTSLDEQIAQPRLSLQVALAHVQVMCSALVKVDDAALKSCTDAVGLLDKELAMHHDDATKLGFGDVIPGTLSAWVTPAARAEAAPLTSLGARADLLAALWADPTATDEKLDAACKAMVAQRKEAPPAAPGETLAALQLTTVAQELEGCLAVAELGLAEKALGPCIAKGETACLNVESCRVARGLRDALAPRAAFTTNVDTVPKTDPMPKSLATRAKTIVDRCAPYLR